jgi:hypothetical protein
MPGFGASTDLNVWKSYLSVSVDGSRLPTTWEKGKKDGQGCDSAVSSLGGRAALGEHKEPTAGSTHLIESQA